MSGTLTSYPPHCLGSLAGVFVWLLLGTDIGINIYIYMGKLQSKEVGKQSSELRMTFTCNNTLNEGWRETWHYIRIHSMKGGVRLWCETLHHIRIHSMKGCVRLWCETWHHIPIHSMKGGVRLWCETLHHITIHPCNGCMIVVIWCCHVCRDLQVCYVMLRNVL